MPNFEKYAWLFMRFSGIVLVFLAIGHLTIMLMVDNGVYRIDFNYVAQRWHSPFWQTWDLLLLWLAAQLVFVHAIVPSRNPARQPRLKGEQIAALVPPGRMLYLFRLKDEGILFYYDRPARRLPAPACLPAVGDPMYCLLIESEWRQWTYPRHAETLLHLGDEQGNPIVLVKVD